MQFIFIYIALKSIILASQFSFSSFLNQFKGFYILVTALLLLVLYLYIALKKEKKKNVFFKKISKSFGSFSSENLLNVLLDNLQDYIYIKDRESRFIVASKKLAKIVGEESSNDIKGKTDYDFYSKKLADQFRKNELDIIKSGKPIIKIEEDGKNELNETIRVETSKFPIFDEDNNVIGIVGIGRDINDLVIQQEKIKIQNETLNTTNTLLEERHEEILQQQEELKVQTEKIAEERSLLLTLINSIPDFIYVKDRKSKFLIANKHITKIAGADSPDELIGKTDFEFFDKNLSSQYYRDEQEIMSQNKALINKEEYSTNLNNEKIVISTTKVPILNSSGVVTGLVGIGRDITQQKNTEKNLKEKTKALSEANVLLEERQEEIQQQSEELKVQSEHLTKINSELEELSFVTSKSNNVIIIMNEKGDFQWVNEGFLNRYNTSFEEFVRKNGKNLANSSSYPEIQTVLDEVIKTGKPINYIAKTNLNTTEYIWSNTTISPILDQDGKVIKLIAIDSDITKLKETEEELDKQKSELKKLNGTKDKLFSIIAHDLKNPFHSIMGFSDLLIRSFDSIEDAKKKEFIALMHESSSSAYGLLENLLNWARTQTNRIKFNPSGIDISAIVLEVFNIMSVNAEKKGVTLSVPDNFKEIYAFADYNMVYTIIRNLINNALKFTDKGGAVSVETRKNKDTITISINDTGVGMTPEEQKKLFMLEKFHSTSGTSGEAGTGLGLIVCREFVLKHNSDIQIQSEKGKGSSFIFTLPLQETN